MASFAAPLPALPAVHPRFAIASPDLPPTLCGESAQVSLSAPVLPEPCPASKCRISHPARRRASVPATCNRWSRSPTIGALRRRTPDACGPHHIGGPPFFLYRLGQAEVHQLYYALFREEQIVRLDVTMDHPLAMRRFQRLGHLHS